MKPNIETAIALWTEQVVTYCNPIAKAIDRDFYCFQSPPPKTAGIELMVIGINPGGDGGYRGVRQGESLAQGVNLLDVRPGHIHPDNTSMTSKLSRVFTTTALQTALAEAFAMNIYYFNTKNVETLDKTLEIEVKRFCADKTRELVAIARPKHVLILSTNRHDLAMLGVRHIQSCGHYVKTGELDGLPVLMIPNPGYYKAYSYVNGEAMGAKIAEYINQ